MTLVAAYRPQGIPVLIGDFLITGGGRESARKKIYKVGPNLAVGWSGPSYIAGPILKALFAAFEDKTVSMTDVEDFLTNRPKDELGDKLFYIVGWVIGDQPHCFLWNILCPTKLFYEPHQVIGSGSQRFQALMTADSMGGSWGSKRTNVEQAVYSALSHATELYSDENLERMNRREGFGHGYEILYFDGSEFNYVENIAYFGMDILWDPDDDLSGRCQPYANWYRYHSLSNASVLQVVNLQTGAMRLELITPVFNYLGKDAVFAIRAGSFRADYYCIYLRIQTTKSKTYHASLVLPEVKEGPSRYEKYEKGVSRFELGRDLIKFIYRNITAEEEHRSKHTIPWGWGSAETTQRMVAAGSSMQIKLAQNDKCVVLGFISHENWDKDFASMEHAIMAAADGTIQVYEKGIAVGPVSKRYLPNDFLGIAVEELNRPVVRYYLNSECVFDSPTLPTFPIRGAICLREEGASVSESKISGKWIK